MHIYPKEILPNPSFSIIRTNLSNHYLLRKTNSKDLFHPYLWLPDELPRFRSHGFVAGRSGL